MIRSLLARLSGRSGKWPALRTFHLKMYPTCAACGRNRKLQVHHIKPVHIAPDLELTESNLITLCKPCHYYIGHLTYWHSYNPDVETDAKRWRLKFE